MGSRDCSANPTNSFRKKKRELGILVRCCWKRMIKTICCCRSTLMGTDLNIMMLFSFAFFQLGLSSYDAVPTRLRCISRLYWCSRKYVCFSFYFYIAHFWVYFMFSAIYKTVTIMSQISPWLGSVIR